MWCMKCGKQLFECTCPDIEERLKSLAGTPAAPAAAQNLMARSLHQALNERGGTIVAVKEGKVAG